MNRAPDSGHPPRQQGFVLVVALILLLVMTLLGVAATRGTALEEKMAGNDRNQQLAMQSAEAALRAAEANISAGNYVNSAFNSTGAGGLWSVDPTALPSTPIWFQNATWTTAGNTIDYTTATGGTVPGVAAQPVYIVELLPPVATPGNNLGQANYGSGAPPIQYYRITALATGGDTSATAMLQTVYR